MARIPAAVAHAAHLLLSARVAVAGGGQAPAVVVLPAALRRPLLAAAVVVATHGAALAAAGRAATGVGRAKSAALLGEEQDRLLEGCKHPSLGLPTGGIRLVSGRHCLQTGWVDAPSYGASGRQFWTATVCMQRQKRRTCGERHLDVGAPRLNGLQPLGHVPVQGGQDAGCCSRGGGGA